MSPAPSRFLWALADWREIFEQGDDWEDDWDEGLDGVAEAYRKVFLNSELARPDETLTKDSQAARRVIFFWSLSPAYPPIMQWADSLNTTAVIIVISFLGMVSTLLFISYKMGHDMTIELIDRCDPES